MRSQYSTTSNDTRKNIILSYNGGNSAKIISGILNIPYSTVNSIIKKYLSTGQIDAQRRGGLRPTKLDELQKRALMEWIDEDCTRTLKWLADKIQETFEIPVSDTTIFRYARGFHYTFKRIHLIPDKRNDPETIKKRRLYAVDLFNVISRYADSEIIYLDEVGFNVSMRAFYGRSPRGSPAVVSVPAIRSRNISIFCAMNKQGIINYTSQPNPFNTDSLFLEAIINLIVTLKQNGATKAIFILDNVRFHHSECIRQEISEVGFELLFLPPYSPFCNPIENMFQNGRMQSREQTPQMKLI